MQKIHAAQLCEVWQKRKRRKTSEYFAYPFYNMIPFSFSIPVLKIMTPLMI